MDEERSIELVVVVKYYGSERVGPVLANKVKRELELQFGGGERVEVRDTNGGELLRFTDPIEAVEVAVVDEPRDIIKPPISARYFWPDLAEVVAFCPACEMGIDPGDSCIDVMHHLGVDLAAEPWHLICALQAGEVAV